MSPTKRKRELATRNIRIYSSTLRILQDASLTQGKTIARIISELADTIPSRGALKSN